VTRDVAQDADREYDDDCEREKVGKRELRYVLPAYKIWSQNLAVLETFQGCIIIEWVRSRDADDAHLGYLVIRGQITS